MGRHAAVEGAGVHPLVAEGLARRAAGTTAGGPVGWPGDPRHGSGLGWPDPVDRWPSGSSPAARLAAPAAVHEAPAAGDGDTPLGRLDEQRPRPRTGWRRFFGGGGGGSASTHHDPHDPGPAGPPRGTSVA